MYKETGRDWLDARMTMFKQQNAHWRVEGGLIFFFFRFSFDCAAYIYISSRYSPIYIYIFFFLCVCIMFCIFLRRIPSLSLSIFLFFVWLRIETSFFHSFLLLCSFFSVWTRQPKKKGGEISFWFHFFFCHFSTSHGSCLWREQRNVPVMECRLPMIW